MSLFIASDHGGLELKKFIISQLSDIHFIDLGTNTDDSVHYPNYADKLCIETLKSTENQGILICGTGIGISIRANRFKGIRAALVYDEFSSKMAKEHNNANVLCLGGRTTSKLDALTFIRTWLSTEFEGGRHQIRLDMLDAPTPRK